MSALTVQRGAENTAWFPQKQSRVSIVAQSDNAQGQVSPAGTLKEPYLRACQSYMSYMRSKILWAEYSEPFAPNSEVIWIHFTHIRTKLVNETNTNKHFLGCSRVKTQDVLLSIMQMHLRVKISDITYPAGFTEV